MIVYCDTSFLVSLLYEGDANHKAARKLAGRFDGQDFVLCQTHQLELPALVRAATHRAESPTPSHDACTFINRFDRAWNGRIFARRDLALDDPVSMARALAEAPGWSKRHTSFELCISPRLGPSAPAYSSPSMSAKNGLAALFPSGPVKALSRPAPRREVPPKGASVAVRGNWRNSRIILHSRHRLRRPLPVPVILEIVLPAAATRQHVMLFALHLKQFALALVLADL